MGVGDIGIGEGDIALLMVALIADSLMLQIFQYFSAAKAPVDAYFLRDLNW